MKKENCQWSQNRSVTLLFTLEITCKVLSWWGSKGESLWACVTTEFQFPSDMMLTFLTSRGIQIWVTLLLSQSSVTPHPEAYFLLARGQIQTSLLLHVSSPFLYFISPFPSLACWHFNCSCQRQIISTTKTKTNQTLSTQEGKDCVAAALADTCLVQFIIWEHHAELLWFWLRFSSYEESPLNLVLLTLLDWTLSNLRSSSGMCLKLFTRWTALFYSQDTPLPKTTGEVILDYTSGFKLSGNGITL